MFLVHKDGYHFVTGLGKIENGELTEVRGLTADGVLVDGKYLCRQYDRPRKKLFRTFSALKEDETSIIRFASKYGLLGIDILIGVACHQEPQSNLILHSEGKPYTEFQAEPLHEWINAKRKMSRAVELWNMVRPYGDRDSLDKHIERDSAGIYYHSSDGGTYLLSHDSYHPEWLRNKTYIGACYALLERWVNEETQGGHSLRLQTRKDGTVTKVLEPRTLLVAMWEQLMDEIVGEDGEDRPRFTVCQCCGKQFANQRSTAKWCSAKCQKRHERKTNSAPEDRDKRESTAQ